MQRKQLYVILFFLSICSRVFCTHIVGGEIYYDKIGPDDYRITLKIFRDCSSAQNASYDDPAVVMIYDGAGIYQKTVQMTFPGAVNVPDSINNPCIIPPASVCVEEATYEAIVSLTPKPGGYYLVYQRCCRNGTILNLVNPGGVGSTYMEHIPGPEQVTSNSSPRFNKRPKKYICNGYDVDFDHSATDPDGDSLVYSFISPVSGLNACCPMLGPNASPSQSVTQCSSPPDTCPKIGLPPPYANVPFSTPYSGSYPVSSNPALTVNAVNGEIHGIPNINGQWVVGVCVKEYRNGVLIGTHIRDFQYNVTSCTPLIVSAIAEQTVNCFGFTVGFLNQSTINTPNPVTYFWDFGVPDQLNDTSIFQSPSFTYADTGKFVVTLIINKGRTCSDTATEIFTIYPLLNPNFSFTSTNACVSDNSFNFLAGGDFASYSTFMWDFGAAGTPSTSNQQFPPAVSFSGSGSFPVTLTVKEAICTDAYIDTVHIYDYPQASFSADSIFGCQPLTAFFSDSSLHGTPVDYLWYFGDGDSSVLANPSHVYQDSGSFDVTLTIITTSGCRDTSSFVLSGLVNVMPAPVASFTASPQITDVFHSTIALVDSSVSAVSMIFSTGDGPVFDHVPESHYYEDFGDYELMQVTYGSNGCPDTARLTVKILPEHLLWIPNAFTPQLKPDGLNDVFKPEGMGIYEYTMTIFDRWGNQIFQTNDFSEGWNGTFKGKYSPVDVYVYTIRYRDVVENIEHVRTGTFSLIR